MFAVLHIADFALPAVLRAEPDAAGKPAALFSDTSKKSVVLAANPLARAAGVYPGMTAPQAVARCPALLIRAPNAAAEAEARAALLAVGFTLSPTIEDTAPGICTADLKGTEPAASLAQCHRAITALAMLGLHATAGMARTPLLALYAARAAGLPGNSPASAVAETPAEYAAAPSSSSRPSPRDRALNLARNLSPTPATEQNSELHLPFAFARASASTEAAPGRSTSTNETGCESKNADESGDAPASAGEIPFTSASATVPASASLTAPSSTPHSVPSPVLHVTDVVAFLAPLPLAAADPAPALATVLHQWGLRTLGDLTALPRDEIVRRFGAEGLALWQRAAGGTTRPLKPFVPSQTFSATMQFEQEIETLEPLLFILRRFLDRLSLELRTSQHVAAELQLTLRLEDEAQHARSFRLPEPTADVEILFRALHTHLESLTTAAAIVAVTLALTPARPLVRQQGLFETGLRDPHGFAETLARVSALVGAERVGTPQLADTHRPDTVKLTAPAPMIAPAAEPPLHPTLGPPLRRFRPPLPARLEFTDGRPTFLWTEHVRGEIALHSPPWRSSGEWWQRDRTWARTEWDIALATGGVYRLLREGESYFLEGEYD